MGLESNKNGRQSLFQDFYWKVKADGKIMRGDPSLLEWTRMILPS